MILKALIFLTIVPTVALASAGSSHETSVTEVLWPLFNFSVVFIPIIYLLRKKLKIYFDQNADIIRELFEKAKKSHQGAEERKREFEMKIANLSSQEEQIMKDAITSTVKFSDEYEKITNEKIERFEKDSASKLVNEKETGLRNIQEVLVDSIIKKTKINIKNDDNKKDKVASKLFV